MAYTVWQRAMAMMVNIDHDAEKKADLLWKCNFRAIMVQTHQGTESRHTGVEVDYYLQPYRKLGFTVGHWGALFGPNAAAEAVVAANWDAQIDAQFYVPNPELNYKFTGGDGKDQCPTCFERNQEFALEYKSRTSHGNVGVSSYGRFDKEDLHWAAWLNILNARALPQAYANEQGWEYTPRRCYLGAIDVKQPWNPMYHPKTGEVIPGFPLSYVHVSIAKPDPTDPLPLKIEGWIDLLRRAKAEGHTLGFSCYEAENYAEADLYKLGEAIAKYQLAGI